MEVSSAHSRRHTMTPFLTLCAVHGISETDATIVDGRPAAGQRSCVTNPDCRPPPPRGRRRRPGVVQKTAGSARLAGPGVRKSPLKAGGRSDYVGHHSSRRLGALNSLSGADGRVACAPPQQLTCAALSEAASVSLPSLSTRTPPDHHHSPGQQAPGSDRGAPSRCWSRPSVRAASPDRALPPPLAASLGAH